MENTFFEVIIAHENPITGEPHIHFFTDDRDKAQAFVYTLETLAGAGDYAISVWAKGEGRPACYPCEKAVINHILNDLPRAE